MPVYLPLQKFEKCGSCGRTESLKLCAACGEQTYCSQKCQKDDWNSHKKYCGKTDRIDLKPFYPLLAYLAEAAHFDSYVPAHPALSHQIVNDGPNPSMLPHELPDGSGAKLLVLGRQLDPREMDPSTKTWWPKAHTLKVMSKMMRRVAREGYLLPIVMSLCLALVAEMYTTTSVAESDQRRSRLKYRSSPIADFGICIGSADVKYQDRLAYLLPNYDFLLGQDPDEHYWIYFTTMKGEEVTLDVGMFTFNFCFIVDVGPYLSSNDVPVNPFVPAYLNYPELQAKVVGDIFKERRRVSFLRNQEVHDLVGTPEFWKKDDAQKRLVALMDSINCGQSDEHERTMLLRSLYRSCHKIRDVLAAQQWKRYPPEPLLAIEQDPNEYDNMKRDKSLRRIMKEHMRVRKNNQRHQRDPQPQ